MGNSAQFRALFDSGVICEWYRPQTWRNVFSEFKLVGVYEGRGILYCDGVLVRETGRVKTK